MRRLLFSCCLAVLFFTCKPTRHPYQYHPPATGQAVGTAKLMFVSFRISTDSLPKSKIELINVNTVAGTLKEQTPAAVTPRHIEVRLLDNKNQILQSVVIEHPLFRSTEYSSDQGVIQRKEILLPTAEFFVRLVFSPGASSLQVIETMEGQPAAVTNIPLPQ